MFTSLPLVTLMGALAAPSLVQAVPAGPGFPYWAGHRAPWSPSYKKALYFLENDSEGAKLGAVEICEDGTLSNTAETPTGGKGMLNINSTSHEPLGPDSLNSQSTVITGDDVRGCHCRLLAGAPDVDFSNSTSSPSTQAPTLSSCSASTPGTLCTRKWLAHRKIRSARSQCPSPTLHPSRWVRNT